MYYPDIRKEWINKFTKTRHEGLCFVHGLPENRTEVLVLDKPDRRGI
jgi:hypothetical protein